MLGKLYLLKNFNNYFNRKVIRYTSLNDYLPVGSEYFVIGETTGVNFNPNDGISTEHVIGSAGVPFANDWNPDYCLYVEEDNIISRWFVTKAERLRDKQYMIRLKRDSVADYFDQVKVAPIYVEKGHLKDDDYMLVNSEGMKFNQIKAMEYYLKDKTKCPWLVAYITQKRNEDWQNIEGSYTPSAPTSLPVIEDDPTMRALFYNETTHSISTAVARQRLEDVEIRFNGYSQFPIPIPGPRDQWNKNWGGYTLTTGKGSIAEAPIMGRPEHTWPLISGEIAFIHYSDYSDLWSRTGQYCGNSFFSGRTASEPVLFRTMPALGYNVASYEGLPSIEREKLWYSRTNDKVYKATFGDTAITSPETLLTNTELINTYKNQMPDGPALPRSGQPAWTIYRDRTENMLSLIAKGTRRNFSLTEVATGTWTTTLYKDANHCLDVPYDIIAIPFGYLPVYNGATKLFDTDLSMALNFMRRIVVEKESNIYDVQLLPYCPIQTGVIQDEKIDVSGQSENGIFSYIIDKLDNTKKVGIFLYSSYSTTSFDITKLGTSLLSEDEINVSDVLRIENRKIQNECELFRLISPNYQGMFEFNVAKVIWPGETSINSFNVDISFRPYSPYIHINPDFGFLYGLDWNDSRGLVCGGDFSISSISDAWKQYQINNKNYQTIFDRQLTNMEVMRGIEREQEAWMLHAGMFGGAGLGALAGSKIPGGAMIKGIGAGIGALGGGIFGGIAANKDRELNEKAYKENREFSIDMFNMQLDNIKALPNSLTKVSTLSYNFKFFPILEYYRCTNKEIEALENKIKYNGMTVGRIDNMNNYLYNDFKFFKGQVIRLEDISTDSNVAMDVYNEVNKGIFIKSEE